jgi:hypothetical protein
LVLIGCAEKVQRSLIGDFDAPDHKTLENETLFIGTNLDGREVYRGKRVIRAVSYEIRPGGRARFEQRLHNSWPFSPGDVDVQDKAHEFQLSNTDYLFARSKLALLRPHKLGWGIDVRPVGCDHVFDGPFESGVAFSRSGKEWAMFQLQYSCTGPAAGKVRETLASVIERLDEARRAASEE